MHPTSSHLQITKSIPPELHGYRLDRALSILLPEHSRARLQQWIKNNFITVDGKTLRAKDKVHAEQMVNINAVITAPERWQAQAIDLNIVYADSDIVVINKPAGLVVHPGAGRADTTLLNALLYHYPELKNIPRAGIIHRLDKDTSGLLVVTRTLNAHTKLTTALQKREIKREYLAIVHGIMAAGGKVDAPIARHPTKRTHMAVVTNGKPAVTHYRVLQRLANHTYVQLQLETGRTHQIRVHLAHIGYPIVGDPTYKKIGAGIYKNQKGTTISFPRQALHAWRLELTHPTSGKKMHWEAPQPEDMQLLLNNLMQP